MRNHVTIAATMAAVIIACSHPISAQHMIGPKGSIPLREDSSRLLIKFEPTFAPQERQNFLAELAPILRTIYDNRVEEGFLACSLFAPQSTMRLSDSLRSLPGIDLAEPYYLTTNNTQLLADETFIVAFRSNVSRGTIDSIAIAQHVLIDREMESMPNVFLIRNSKRSARSLLDVSNTFAQLSIAAYSCPNFNCPIVKSVYHVFDYYHPHQYHSKKVIGNFNQASVWDFAGLTRPVTVALVDDGFNWHYDIPANRILQGKDFNALDTIGATDNDPSPGYHQAHGMACAGIIAASHTADSSGLYATWSAIFGLNPYSKILPVKIFNDNGLAGAIRQWGQGEAIIYAAERAEVLSNSWANVFQDPIGTFPHLDSALQRAAILGRGGKGCPVIFAAGNSAASPYYYSPTAYPAYLPWCFAVGATQLDDSLWSYSQHDSTLDVVAPSSDGTSDGGVWTLDQAWDAGYNPYPGDNPKFPITWHCDSPNNEDINCLFGGTSAACPLVSGVASLLLARDSMLTAYQVYDILRHSAVPIGSPVPNDMYGYGRVDAFRAVLSISHGDANNDAALDINDLYAIMDYLSASIEPFPSVKLGDCDCDGVVDIGDTFCMVDYLTGGAPPVKPCFVF